MPTDSRSAHPYIPNAAPEVRRRMLAALGLGSIEQLYDGIPAELRLRRRLDLPPPLPAEAALRRHAEALLAKNRPAGAALSFLGGGCAAHSVPAVCDEIANRGEFLTAYGAYPYSDHGKFQAMYEYQSLLGELVGMEVVTAPTYDGGCAAGSALRMACRLTGRREIVIAGALGPDRLSQIRGFTLPVARLVEAARDPASELADLGDLAARIGDDTAAVYLETPSHLGPIETRAPAIVALAQRRGALAIVGVDPSSLGVLAAPGAYGADIVVGDLQPLGIHMLGGGGLAGFIATRDEPRVVAELPTYLISRVPAAAGSGFGFGVSTMERTSYDKREAATDYYGTTQWLWGIVAGAYLALMGPAGMAELGEGIMRRVQYAARRLGAIPGVRAPALDGVSFKEMVVSFAGTGRSVAEINRALLARGIHGGAALGAAFPRLGESALYCFTELHTQADIDRLADGIEEIVR
jgi:glycine dehydrogenase subunit 1